MTLKFTGLIFCIILAGCAIHGSEIKSENHDTTTKKDLNLSPLLIHMDDEPQADHHHKVVPRIGVNPEAMLEVEKNIVNKIIDRPNTESTTLTTTTVAPVKNQTTHSGREGVTAHTNLKSATSIPTKSSLPLNTSTTNVLSPSSTVATTKSSTLKSATTTTTSNITKLSNSTLDSAKSGTIIPATTTTTTTTTTTPTTKTTTTTPSTTTPVPKKPTITFSLEDLPQEVSSSKKVTSHHHSSEKLGVEEPEQPIAQPSQEINLNPNSREHTDYIIPVVAIMFAVPIILGAIIVSYRRIKDFWSTRHYRRMDFLVDGMYND